MRFQWEHKDVICGRVVGQQGRDANHMIGTAAWCPRSAPTGWGASIFTLIRLHDGNTNAPLLVGEMAEFLSCSNFVPVEFLEADGPKFLIDATQYPDEIDF